MPDRASDMRHILSQIALATGATVMESSADFTAWFQGSKIADRAGRPITVYHGSDTDKMAGFPIFFSDDPEEAEGYGSTVIEAHLRMVKPFDPARLAVRANGDWTSNKPRADLGESKAFFAALVHLLGEEEAERRYYHIEGGSWSGVEHPKVLAWLRQSGYDGFTCWEGEGQTYAVFNRDQVWVKNQN